MSSKHPGVWSRAIISLLLTLQRQVEEEGEADTSGGGGKGSCEGTPALGRAGVGPEESLVDSLHLQGVPLCPHLGPLRLGSSATESGGCNPRSGSHHHHWSMPTSGPAW